MKKNLFYLTAILAVFAAIACKKNDAVTPAVVAEKTTFTVNGNIYTETGSAYTITNVNGTYASLAVVGKTTDGKKAGLLFYFVGANKPVAGTYAVVSDITKATATQVAILAQDSASIAQQGIYASKTGTAATVTVSSSGKLTILLPSTSFTGTNYNNTDPKNTVITTPTISAAGTVVEN